MAATPGCDAKGKRGTSACTNQREPEETSTTARQAAATVAAVPRSSTAAATDTTSAIHVVVVVVVVADRIVFSARHSRVNMLILAIRPCLGKSAVSSAS